MRAMHRTGLRITIYLLLVLALTFTATAAAPGRWTDTGLNCNPNPATNGTTITCTVTYTCTNNNCVRGPAGFYLQDDGVRIDDSACTDVDFICNGVTITGTCANPVENDATCRAGYSAAGCTAGSTLVVSYDFTACSGAETPPAQSTLSAMFEDDSGPGDPATLNDLFYQNITAGTPPPDTTPPASVTNLQNQSAGTTWAYWNWTNPGDSDFNSSIVYINGNNLVNISNNYYNATGLNPSTNYTITIHTKDNNGNVNNTNVSSTATTQMLPDTTPPGTITGLSSSSQGTAWIEWAWTNPADADFDKAIIYIDGNNVINTSSTNYNATGFSCGTNHTITVNTKDTTGNINSTNITNTQSTNACPDTTPPGTITGLAEQAAGLTWIEWAWTNPADADFDKAIVYINGNNLINTSNNNYNATGLNCGTNYTITVHTKDNNGNVNTTNITDIAGTIGSSWANTAWTDWQNTSICYENDTIQQTRNSTTYDVNSCNATNTTNYEHQYISCINPPDSATGLSSTAQGTAWIEWTWTNPIDADFNEAILYIDGNNLANTSSNNYNATGLTCGTNYTITVHTKDNNGNVNTTNITDIAGTTGASWANTTWTDWQNNSICYENDTIQQTRNSTTYDVNTCNATNTTNYEYQYVSCTNPPDAITGLTSPSQGTAWIEWAWTNPSDTDFSEAIIYINGNNIVNTSNNNYNATGLNPSTNYTITVHTKDNNGNVNNTNVSDTQSTSSLPPTPDTTPPSSITNLGSSAQGTTWVYWNWTNPIDADFNEAIIYIDGNHATNTSNNQYNATGLNPSTNYTITIHTKDTTGNINSTDINNTQSTSAIPPVPDTTPPIVTPLNPPDSHNTTNTTMHFRWAATDDNSTSMLCNLTIDGMLNASNIASIHATPANYTVQLSIGLHNWSVTCADNSNNIGGCVTQNFQINSITNTTNNTNTTNQTTSTDTEGGGGSVAARSYAASQQISIQSAPAQTQASTQTQASPAAETQNTQTAEAPAQPARTEQTQQPAAQPQHQQQDRAEAKQEEHFAPMPLTGGVVSDLPPEVGKAIEFIKANWPIISAAGAVFMLLAIAIKGPKILPKRRKIYK